MDKAQKPTTATKQTTTPQQGQPDPAQMPLLDQMLCFDLYATNLAMGRLYKPMLDAIGVTYPQFLVLLALWDRDGQSVGELGARLDLESSTLTPLIKRMEVQGIVTRIRDKADERRVLVSLSEKGAALRAEQRRISECVFAATGLSLDELIALKRLLAKTRRAIGGAGA